MKELLPCPFCGGKAKPFKDGMNWYKGIECRKCKLNIYFFHSSGRRKGMNIGINDDSLDAVIEAWNKRKEVL